MAYVPPVARSSAPAAADDNTKGFYQGSQWIDSVAGVAYTCVSAVTGNAVWTRGGGTLPSVTVQPSLMGTISVTSVQTTIPTYNAGTGWVT